MNEKIIDVLKFFFLTFVSIEIMYYAARSSLNLGLVLLVSFIFTLLYTIDRFKLAGRFLSSRHNVNSNNTKKDQAF